MKSPVILRVFKNGQLLEVKQFDVDQIVIGQQADVQLDLQGEGISPIHCLIELRDAGYYICDLGSQTGTFKNGQAVLDDVVESGDEITIGGYRIVFYVGVPKPKAAPKVPDAKPAAVAAVPLAAVPAEVKPEPVAPPPAPTPSPAAATPPPPVEKVPEKPVVPEKPKPAPPPSAPKAPAAPKPLPSRPEIRSIAAAGDIGRRKTGQTFAPGSEVTDLRDVLKPGKGNVLEVVVAWRERIIDTFHFRKRGQYKMGQSDRDAIQIASDVVPKTWNLLEITNAVKVNVSDAMEFELISSSQGRRGMDECIASGKATRSGQGTSVRLDQNEMICLSMGDGLIKLYIRYAPQAPVVPLLPPLGLSGSELSALVFALVMTTMLAFYISATTPNEMAEEKQEELTRTAQILFNNPPPKPPVPVPPPPPPPEREEPPPPPPKPPEKVTAAQKKQETQKKGQAAQQAQTNQTAARANEVAPKPDSQNRPKKFTSVKTGGAVKLGENAGANANSAKDVSKVGLFSAFGGGGVRSKLDQAYSGAGEVLGQADKATGSSGMAENRAGDDLGSKFKDTGAGGKGTATQGIAGIGTKGRSSGMAAYGSVDGFGSKTTVNIESGGAEEDFLGTIDKEAVRRRVRHYLHEIRGCYVRELNLLEKGQKLEGKVVVSWEIIEQGVARNVRIKSSTLGNSKVENCIAQRLASWSFPEPPKGTIAEVAYPFYLRQEN